MTKSEVGIFHTGSVHQGSIVELFSGMFLRDSSRLKSNPSCLRRVWNFFANSLIYEE